MALLQMQRIFIYGLQKDKKRILELLQRRGVVEISDFIEEDNIFKKPDTNISDNNFEKNIENATKALEILDSYVPHESSIFAALEGKKTITEKEYDEFGDKKEEVIEISQRLRHLEKYIAEVKAEKLKYQTEIEILTPWVGLDIPLNFSGTTSTKAFIGTLPGEWALEEIYEKLSNHTPINIDIISSHNNQTSIFVLCTKNKEDSVYDTLRSIEFAFPSLEIDKSPAQQLEYLNQLIMELDKEILKAKDEIKSYVDRRDELLFLQDYERMRAEQQEVTNKLIQSKNVFIITGFIPEKDSESVVKELKSKFVAEVELKETTKQDQVPVLYENNGFAAPVEGVINSFSPPGANDIDPSMMTALFYYMLFGLMLSDAGYGLLMVIACSFVLIKFKDTMEISTKNNMKMFLYCGIATVFWGILFGSFFGDLIDVVASSFFGVTELPVISALWFYPVEKPMLMLTFSMIVGLIHLLTGLGLQGYIYAKNKDYKGVIYDVVSWFALIISSVVILVSLEMVQGILGITVNIPSVIIDVSTIIALISAIVIVLTNGRESKHPFKRVLKGAYALYGISGYLSDVLSYSRLLALGLATGVIGSVINEMASMVTGLAIGPILFTIIVVFGHLMNFAINALGAYVHTNRLEYVEFFGKFYEGGGKLFKPFDIKTKYYKFKEMKNNEY